MEIYYTMSFSYRANSGPTALEDGSWKKVSSDNQKLLETKEKKIRATCETSAETSSRSQFHERQQGFTSFAIQDDLSAIEENSSPI